MAQGVSSHKAFLLNAFATVRTYPFYWIFGFLLGLELLFLLFYRQVNLDEGWYLWASKLVYEGKLLYRDFAYTQTPILPYIYGFFQRLGGEGLLPGRIVTLGFAIGAFVFSTATAHKVGGAFAGQLCLALITTSLFALNQFTYTATYALTAFFIALAVFTAVVDPQERRRVVLATLWIALAVGVRLSVIVILPAFVLYLVLTSCRRIKALLWISLTVALCFMLLFGLFWLRSGALMTYDIFGFHTDRQLKDEWRYLRMWNMGRLTIEDFVWLILPSVAGLGVGLAQSWQHWRATLRTQSRALLQILLAVSVIALFAVQLLPRTTDSYYNSLQMPLMSLAGSLLVATWFASAPPTRRQYLWLLLILFVFGNGLRQWRAIRRDQPVAYPLRNQVAISQQTGALLQRLAPTGGNLLSFSPHLALEAGMRVYPGYEMAIFAYRPTWSDDEVKTYHVVNNRQLRADLVHGVDAVAFTSFDLEQLGSEREPILALLHEQYRWMATVPEFGPYGDEVNLYLPPQFGEPPPEQAQTFRFGEQIELLGYDLLERREDGQPVLTVTLYWRATARPSHDYTVFVQLLTPQNERATGWDNPPCRATCPTTTWRANEWLRDEYRLPLTGLTTGNYTLLAGMYDANSGQRLTVQNENGEVVGDFAPLGQITRSSAFGTSYSEVAVAP